MCYERHNDGNMIVNNNKKYKTIYFFAEYVLGTGIIICRSEMTLKTGTIYKLMIYLYRNVNLIV